MSPSNSPITGRINATAVPQGDPVHPFTLIREHGDTRDEPWRWVCSIIASFDEAVAGRNSSKKSKTRVASGTLITPRHVLTNAHPLIGLKVVDATKPPLKLMASSIVVIPGRDDDAVWSRPFKTHNSIGFHVPQEFLYRFPEAKADPHDYAIIDLGEDIGAKHFPGKRRGKLKWWNQDTNSFIRPVDPSNRVFLEGRKVNAAGYRFDDDIVFDDDHTPAGRPSNAFDHVHRAFYALDSTGKQKPVPLIAYGMRASPGHSGGPVWYRHAGRRFLIAIMRGERDITDEHGSSNESEGVLITGAAIKNFEKWGAKNLSLV